MTPWEVILAAERRQDEALAAHFMEAERLCEVRHASVAYWPRLLTAAAMYLEDELQRALAWRRAHPNWVPRYYPPVSPEQRARRLLTIVAMRGQGATLTAIGAELGLTGGRVGQILAQVERRLAEVRRKLRREDRS